MSITTNEDRRRRGLPRKTLVLLIVTALVAVAGVAFALYVLLANVTGTVSTKTLTYQWDNITAPTTAGDASTCTATASGSNPGNGLTVSVSSYPGDTCTITANLKTIGTESGKVTGMALTGLPSGWTAEVVNGTCGKTVNGTYTPVSFKITVGPSGSGTIGGGLTLSPQSQVPGTPTCAVQTGA